MTAARQALRDDAGGKTIRAAFDQHAEQREPGLMGESGERLHGPGLSN